MVYKFNIVKIIIIQLTNKHELNNRLGLYTLYMYQVLNNT